MNKDELVKKIAKVKSNRSMGYSVLFSCFMICLIYFFDWNPYCIYAILLPLVVSMWLLRPGPEAEVIDYLLMSMDKGGETLKRVK